MNKYVATLFSFISVFLSMYYQTQSQRELNNFIDRGLQITFNNFCRNEPIFLNSPIQNSKWKPFFNWLGFGIYSFSIPTTLSNYKGEFMLYYDGLTVWNNKSEIIENGDTLIDFPPNNFPDTAAFGLITCNPIATICPFPEQPNKYILFTSAFVPLNGLFPERIVNFSILDFKLNDGKGKILLKRQYLTKDSLMFIEYFPVLHRNRKDIWIFAIDTNLKIHSFLFNKDGPIKTNYINQEILDIFTNFSPYFSRKCLLFPEDYYYYPRGLTDLWQNIKVSSNGKFVAIHLFDKQYSNEINFVNKFLFFQVLNESGELRNPIYINFDSLITNDFSLKGLDDISHPHFQFSPNSKKFYTSCEIYKRGDNDIDTSIFLLTQFDLSSWGSKSINTSRNHFILHTVLSKFPRSFNNPKAFLLSPNGKLYLYFYTHPRITPDDSFLVIVENPNENAESLKLTLKKFGLPRLLAFNQNFFHAFIYRFIDYETPLCEGGTLCFKFTPFAPEEVTSDSTTVFQWTGPGGFFSTEKLPCIANVQRENFGWYKVHIKTKTDEFFDSIYVLIDDKPIIQKSKEYLAGDIDSLVLYLNKRYCDIRWFDGSSDTAVTIRNPGRYWVTVRDTFCCEQTDTIWIQLKTTTPKIEVILPDTIARVGETNFGIPIVAKKDKDLTFDSVYFSGEIRFDRKAFLPWDAFQTRVDGKDLVVKISGEVKDWIQDYVKLGTIYGTVFLPDSKVVPLIFGDFTFETQNEIYEPNKIDGKLKFTGVCVPELLPIEFSQQIEILGFERDNAKGTGLMVSSSSKTLAELKIYNLLGQIVYETKGLELAEGINIIPVKDLSTGPCVIRIFTNSSNKFYSKILVVYWN